MTSDGSTPTLAIPLAGTGTALGQLSATASLDFGSVAVNRSKNLSGSPNASGAGVTVTAASSDNSEFVVSGLPLPATIPAGQSKGFSVTFSPQTSGTAVGTLSFAGNAANSPTESLTGTGTAPVAHSVDLSWTASSATAAGYNVYRGGL